MGVDCVIWYKPSSSFPYMKGVAAVVISWVLSPVGSGICAAFLYGLTYCIVLRAPPEISYWRARMFFPVIVGIAFAINFCFIVLKGTKSKAGDIGTKGMVDAAKAGDLGPVLIGAAIT